MPSGIYPRTDFHKKIAMKNLGKCLDNIKNLGKYAEKGHVSLVKGRCHTEIEKDRMSISAKERIKRIGNPMDKDWIKKKHYESLQKTEYKNLQRKISRERWKNPEFKEKMIKIFLKSLHQKPNKPEQFLNQILQDNFPNEFKFVGDGSVIIEGFNPDFINCNGKKLIIELFGEYHHNLPKNIETDKRKLNTYDKYGYKTLIIWSLELKQPEMVIERIKNFG